MKARAFFRFFFVGIGVYDFLLGVLFLFFYKNIFESLDIPLPNHPGYVYVPALFLMSGAVGEFLIARNLLRNIDLVVVRLLMKLSFTGALLYCYFKYDISELFLILGVLSVTGIIGNSFFLSWAKKQT